MMSTQWSTRRRPCCRCLLLLLLPLFLLLLSPFCCCPCCSPEVARCKSRHALAGTQNLKGTKVASSAQLNDKFQATGKFQMSYGSLSLFYGGLESLIGPPLMVKDPNRVDSTTGEMEATLFRAMENEHTDPNIKDTAQMFKSTNGTETYAMLCLLALPACPATCTY